MDEPLTRLDHIMADRRAKLDALRAAGIDPFPPTTKRTHTVAQATAAGEGALVAVAGRLLSIREHGKTIFGDLVDESGRLQLVWKANETPTEVFDLVKLLDPGDHLSVSGSIFTTKTGQLSVLVKEQQVLAKAIRPIPRSWQDFEQKEERFRKRYLDLLANPAVAERFRTRSRIIQAVRSELLDRDFLEVETPIFHPIPGGTLARPFVTHYHDYDTDVYLRVAPELYLKRLLVGSYERVFELAKCFRNEGADLTHNPEFFQVEAYAAYWDYEQVMAALEAVVSGAVKRVFGTIDRTLGHQELSFATPFARQTFHEVSGGSDDDATFKVGVKKIMKPTFVTNHPVSHIPLGKTVTEKPELAQSFQLIISGVETAIGWSELNDPDLQRQRFLEQEALRASGDEEAMRLDTDFLEALEYGMPPAGGLGLGIDRLVTILTDVDSIREAVLFPYMKPLPRIDPQNSSEGNRA